MTSDDSEEMHFYELTETFIAFGYLEDEAKDLAWEKMQETGDRPKTDKDVNQKTND